MSEPNLAPEKVASRLAELRRLCTSELDAEARTRLEREHPTVRPEQFEQAVARRLGELRALCDLARYLHRRDSGR